MTKLTQLFSWFKAIKKLAHNWFRDALQSTCHLSLAFTYDLLSGHNVHDSISGHYDDGYLDLIHAPLKTSSLRAKRAFAAWIRCGVICQFKLIRVVILASYAPTSWSSCCRSKANVCNEMWNTTLAIWWQTNMYPERHSDWTKQRRQSLITSHRPAPSFEGFEVQSRALTRHSGEDSWSISSLQKVQIELPECRTQSNLPELTGVKKKIERLDHKLHWVLR